MRVLTVHNFYGSEAPSGENTAYCAERDLLRDAGCELAEYTRHSDEIRGAGVVGALRGGISAPWNPFAAAELRKRIRRFDPDVVHVHNTFPLISPAIFHALRDERAAVVMTCHNFRITCASAMLSRDGVPCTVCVDGESVLPSLRYGCYRGSFLTTLPLASSIALHRALGTWQHCVDAFVALTEFQRGMLIRAGVPADRLHVKPNAYPGAPCPVAWSQRSDNAIFVGRIGPEKGLDVLLEAWRAWGPSAPRLEIVGGGPGFDAALAFVTCHGMGDRVHFHGALSFEQTQRLLGSSRLLIVPSRVFEGYPMVVREAYALGVPIAASDIGSLRSLVDDGLTGVRFASGDSQALLARIRELWAQPDRLAKMATAANERFRLDLAPEKNAAILLDLYSEARKVRAGRIATCRRA